MSQPSRGVRIWVVRAIIPAVIVGGLALFAGAGNAKANDWDCNRQVAYAKGQLHEAIEDHGSYSPQANYWLHEVHEAYERCSQASYENRGRYYQRSDEDGNRNRGYADAAVERGYRDGQADGFKDWRERREYRPEKHDDYEDSRGYFREYGDKGYYKQQYREGFLRGYQNGYYSH